MKKAMKSLLGTDPHAAVEDLLGIASLFALVFAVLSLPSPV